MTRRFLPPVAGQQPQRQQAADVVGVAVVVAVGLVAVAAAVRRPELMQLRPRPLRPPPAKRKRERERASLANSMPNSAPKRRRDVGGGGGGGGGRGGRGGGAPLVDPGKYTITLTAGNAKDSMAVEVEDDPRVQMSNEDRAKKRQTIQTLVTMIKDAEEPRRKATGMTTAMTNLLASWQAPNAAPVPDGVRKAVEDFNARLKVAAAVFEAAGGGRGGRGGGGGGGRTTGGLHASPGDAEDHAVDGSNRCLFVSAHH